jgi:hypothetical protein
VNLFVVACPNAFRNADQRTTVDVSILGFVAHTENADAAAEVPELSLTPLGERALDRLALTESELRAANELVHGLLDQTVQIAGSQVQ